MKRRILWIVAIVVLAGAITGGYLYTQGLGGRPAFRTAAVSRGPLTSAVSATGTLNAVITVQVGSQVSGQIKELHADFNSQVKKDQVIARIDPDTFEAKVNQTKAQVDAARASVLNQQAAVEKTRADLENTRAAFSAATATCVCAGSSRRPTRTPRRPPTTPRWPSSRPRRPRSWRRCRRCAPRRPSSGWPRRC
jgi:multidrug efflux pump subunit AcrA (membrane-fusion protein)